MRLDAYGPMLRLLEGAHAIFQPEKDEAANGKTPTPPSSSTLTSCRPSRRLLLPPPGSRTAPCATSTAGSTCDDRSRPHATAANRAADQHLQAVSALARAIRERTHQRPRRLQWALRGATVL